MSRPQESAIFNPRHVQQLRKLVSQGEGQHLEFKRKATYPEKIVREMVAFANTKGGSLLLGVADDGTLAGLKHPDEESHVMREALKKCHPPLPVTEGFIPIGSGRTIIRYVIKSSEKKPHYQLNGNGRDAFIRVNDQSIRASREMLEIVKRSRRKKDVRFHYGEHEKFLMEYLDVNAAITLKKFTELSGLKKFYASRKLVLLVLANVLKITPHEKGDQYSLAFRKQ